MTKTISPFSNWHFETSMQGITTHHKVTYNKRLKQGVKGKVFYGQSSVLGYNKWKKTWKKKTTVGIKPQLAAVFWPWPNTAQAKDHHGPYPAVGSWGGLTTPKEAICAAFSHCVYLSSASSSAEQVLSHVSPSKSLWSYELQPRADRFTSAIKYNFTACDLNWMQTNKQRQTVLRKSLAS